MGIKVYRVMLTSGEATVNLRGSVRSSLDTVNDKVEMELDEVGVWVTYTEVDKDPASATVGQQIKRGQLVPAGKYSNALFDPVEQWSDDAKPKK